MSVWQTLHACLGHNRDGFVLLSESLRICHRLENRQTIGHPVASRTPILISDIICAPVTAKGGYTLARDPAKVTLKDILDPLEGDCALVKCTRRASACSRSSACVAREIWQEVSRALALAMEKITLKTMMEKYEAKQAGATLAYNI